MLFHGGNAIYWPGGPQKPYLNWCKAPIRPKGKTPLAYAGGVFSFYKIGWIIAIP
jgi:hypothetical protein